MTEKPEVKGVCTCGAESWTWEIINNQLTLTCLKCGREAHFTLMTPTIDMFLDATERGKH